MAATLSAVVAEPVAAYRPPTHDQFRGYCRAAGRAGECEPQSAKTRTIRLWIKHSRKSILKASTEIAERI